MKVTMDASTVRSFPAPTSHLGTLASHPSMTEVDSQFLKTAAQELNNPITTIKTALTLLNSSSLRPKQRERYLAMIGQACDRQSHLINDVFELLELQLMPETKVFESVHLWDLVPGVVSTYQPLATEHNLLLAYTVSNHLPPVLAIASHLKQVLVSLVSNRIQCMEAGGRLWVTAHPCSDGKIALVIQDNGHGIPPALLPRVFDSFYRSTSGGSGLGLTLVQQLLAHCGASIAVQSKPGQGTTFTILLKMAPD